MFTTAFVNEATGLTVTSSHNFSSVTTDSRKVAPGCLFVALKGDQFDGHEFIPAAIQKGAAGILCRQSYTHPGGKNGDLTWFKVIDPLTAFRQMGAAWRKHYDLPVICVAGSVGKTTTKELLSALLRGKWTHVLKTQGSQNGFIGIPMTLLEIRESHEVAVIEVGIDEPGTMPGHIRTVCPTAAILTAIGPEHLEKLVDLPTVAREESSALSETAKLGGWIAINRDDPWIAPLEGRIEAPKTLAFTLNEHASPSSSVLVGQLTPDENHLSVSGMGLSSEVFLLPLLGKHNATNLLAALTLAAGLGLTAKELQAGLVTFKGADGRSQIRELPGPTPVLCDYYNANPASVAAALELLSKIARSIDGSVKKRWVCLGDMLELGPEEEKFHRGIADQILEQKIEHTLLYGPRMKALANELSSRGYAGTVDHFESHAELAARLIGSASPRSAILIKGSRGMTMEEVWKLFEPEARTRWGSMK